MRLPMGHSLPTRSGRPLSEELDASFFSEYQLAVVDFCCKGSPYLRSRLEAVERKVRLLP